MSNSAEVGPGISGQSGPTPAVEERSSPESMEGTRARRGNAVISAVALVGAVGDAVGPLERRHVDVLARDVLNRRIARFPQDHRVPSIGNDAARNLDHDSISVGRNRYRMIRAW